MEKANLTLHLRYPGRRGIKTCLVMGDNREEEKNNDCVGVGGDSQKQKQMRFFKR